MESTRDVEEIKSSDITKQDLKEWAKQLSDVNIHAREVVEVWDKEKREWVNAKILKLWV